MPLETATYINGLVATNPVGASDDVSQGDDHLRLIKSTLLNTFPGVTGAVTSSHTELNLVDGLTGRTGSGNLVASAAPTFTGTAQFNGVNVAGTIVAAGATFTGSFALVSAVASGTIQANLFLGSGASLTTLNASNLASGTVPAERVAAAAVTQHEAALAILETQITDGAVLARVAGTETVSGQWTYSTRPRASSQGGFLSNESASNTGGKVTLSASVPATASEVGSPGDMRFVYV